MNRRDTILVAVFINMGLLVALFVMGLKPKSASEALSQKIALKAQIPTEPIEKQAPAVTFDQVDHILSQYLTQEQGAAPAEIVTPVTKEIEAATASTDPKLQEVIVKQGDVLEKIAKRVGISVEELMRINRLSDTKLQIGQILYVPEGPKLPMQLLKSKEPRYYTVKTNDNPWTIAIKNKIKVEELLRLNNLDEAKAKKLKPGDRLKIE